MDRTVEEIEDMRLKELRKTAALMGPLTDPSILIEIQELSNRQNKGRSTDRRQFVNTLDYDFLMNTVAAALLRLNKIEDVQARSEQERHWRQLLHDLWMIMITVIVFAVLLLQLNAH